MKRYELVFAALLVPIDYLVIYLAAWSAYAIRFNQINGLLPVVESIPLAGYLKFSLIAAAAALLVLAISGVFTIKPRPFSYEAGRIFVGSSFSILLVIVTIFFRREYISSRFIVLAAWGLSILYLWVAHIIIRLIQKAIRQGGVGAKRIVIVGQDQTTTTLIEAFHGSKSLGVNVIKVYPQISLEMLNELEGLIRDGRVDEVIVADPSIPKNETVQVLERCNDNNVTFRYVADLFETEIGRISVSDVAGVPIIEVRRTPLDGWGRIIKRSVDIAGGLLGLIVALIPGSIVAIAIKLDSAGPVFLPLERVGQGQRRFKLWKFRSMIRDAHALKPQLMASNERADGPLFKINHDPRITRVGAFIRKTSLDELPQLFNVILGTMSLVGPRPHEPEEVARYERHHKKLLTVKPGMTGMAQVSGRSNLSFEEEVRLDTYYIENWSLSLDLQILVRTPLAVLKIETAA
jgi:exopolysaccharide biosynthesis polyprenyl glycosylphosphotransferase